MKVSDELSRGSITPLEFLKKVANVNKIIKEETFEAELEPIGYLDDSDSENDDDEGDMICVICDPTRASVLLFPCTHCCLCVSCWEKRWSETSFKAPKCPRTDCNRLVKKHTIISFNPDDN